MTFKFEQISREQGEELDKKYNFINPMTNQPPGTQFWAVDAKANAFIVALGMNGIARDNQPTQEYFALIWNEKRIDIQFYWDRDIERNVMTRCVKSIKAPSDLVEDVAKKLALEDLVKEAIIGHEVDSGDHEFRYSQLAEPEAV
jgi:hypothetical protein